MNDTDIRFLESSFKTYYLSHMTEIPIPVDIAKREFGYMKFSSGMIRHIGLQDEKALRLLLIENLPSDVYYSNSYYLFPNMEMQKKDWQGADLIFDIDAKDLNLECRTSHTYNVCGECENVYQTSSQCTQCNSTKYSKHSLSCKNCTSAAKKEVTKLLNILENDIGINPKLMKTYFSGNEGFHVHVEKSEYNVLESRSRTALADYVRFYNAMPEFYGVRRSGFDKKKFPNKTDPGWHGRIAKLFGKNKSTSVMETTYEKFSENLKNAQHEIGACIDTQVTGDIHRIFRMPGSLNSKSGLAKIYCNDLKTFDPYKQACLIGSNLVRIRAQCPIKFSLGGKIYGPYLNKTELDVEQFAAVYMLCKGIAHIIPT